MKPAQKKKEDYVFFKSYETRWRDNDVYGHMNNVVFYEFVDSIVNYWLNASRALPVPDNNIIGLVAHTQCDYFAPLGFPNTITCGLRADKIGNSSVTYGIGLFNSNQVSAAAQASLIHVYVDSLSREPVSLPVSLAVALKGIS